MCYHIDRVDMDVLKHMDIIGTCLQLKRFPKGFQSSFEYTGLGPPSPTTQAKLGGSAEARLKLNSRIGSRRPQNVSDLRFIGPERTQSQLGNWAQSSWPHI